MRVSQLTPLLDAALEEARALGVFAIARAQDVRGCSLVANNGQLERVSFTQVAGRLKRQGNSCYHALALVDPPGASRLRSACPDSPLLRSEDLVNLPLRLGLLAPLLVLEAVGCTSTPAPQPVSIIASEMKFEPSRVTVQVGRPVVVTLRNVGQVDHDLVAPALPARNVRTEHTGSAIGAEHSGELFAHARPGSSGSLVFTPTEAGAYRIFCSQSGHEAAGMLGELLVSST